MVKTLVTPLINRNHKIYFENFFVSVKFVQDLREVKLFGAGTENVNRKGLTKFNIDKDLKRGEYY